MPQIILQMKAFAKYMDMHKDMVKYESLLYSRGQVYLW